jgi:hypothetical protein
MIGQAFSGTLMKKYSARLSVMSLVLGLGLAVLPSHLSEAGIAHANEGGVTDMYTVSESEVADSPTPTPKANTDSCAEGLPTETPSLGWLGTEIFCGYMKFEESNENLVYPVTNLPPGPGPSQRNPTDEGNGYTGQGLNEYINVYDPTRDPAIGANHGASNGTNTKYFAIGMWWQDHRHYWVAHSLENLEEIYNPRYKTVTRYRTEAVEVDSGSNLPGAGTIIEYQRVPYQVEVTNDNRVIPYTIEDRDFAQTSWTSPNEAVTIPPGSKKWTKKKIIYAYYYDRTVNYGGTNFPKAPRTYTNECAAYIGPGYMTGPSPNSATSPWPVPTGVGTYDPQTELKRWNTRPANAESNPYWIEDNQGGRLYSDAGMLYRDWRFPFFNSQEKPQTALGYEDAARNWILPAIENCPDIVYSVSAQDQDCVYLGQTFGSDYGKTFSKDSDYCSNFTPGNYRKEAEGYTTTCQIGEVFWDPDAGYSHEKRDGKSGEFTYQKVFLGCDQTPTENPPATVDDWVHWICDDVAGDFGRNETYNFADCSGPRNDGTFDVADTYRCAAPNNGEPEIIDVESGNVMGDQSQILANGKQVQVRWPAPEGIAVLSDGVLSRVQNPDNPWMNWDVVDGSEPINDSLAINDPNQKVFGNWRENVDPGSASSDLGGPGKDEWDTPWIYLRAYQGAPVNNEGSSVSVGDATVSPEGTIPLGVTTTFNATVKRTVETGLGGTLEINVPVICNMPDAYLYAVSGRATD